MDDIKNTIQEIKEYTMDRLKMPIFFYYFVLLAVWNWDIILLILKSEASIESIILKIKNDKFESGRYLYPLGIAIGGNIVFPLIMYGIDFPLSWINKGRNKKASEVELAKAKVEHNIQQERTGSVTLDALNIQIRVLNQDKVTLTKALEDTSKKLNEHKDDIEEKNNFISIKEGEISELKQIVLSYESSIGYYDFSEEINDFNKILDLFIRQGLDKEEVLTLLKHIFNENNHSNKMAIGKIKGYDNLLRSNIIQEYIDGYITYIKLLPSGIKFMYWLEGVSSSSLINVQNKESDSSKVYKYLEEEDLLSVFSQFANNVKNNRPLNPENSSVQKFLSLDLINFKSISLENNWSFYKLTNLGNELLQYIVINSKNN